MVLIVVGVVREIVKLGGRDGEPLCAAVTLAGALCCVVHAVTDFINKSLRGLVAGRLNTGRAGPWSADGSRFGVNPPSNRCAVDIPVRGGDPQQTRSACGRAPGLRSTLGCVGRLAHREMAASDCRIRVVCYGHACGGWPVRLGGVYGAVPDSSSLIDHIGTQRRCRHRRREQ